MATFELLALGAMAVWTSNVIVIAVIAYFLWQAR
jgi:hypothetical protein